MLGAIAEFERCLMLERQSEGIVRAKLEGKYKGRPGQPKSMYDLLHKFKAEGVKLAQIAKYLNVSLATIYRMQRESVK
jgi:DNA invertase Pin-like site-specific DNA recombinase